MKRRTLDFLFSVGGVLMAVGLVALGVVLSSNADFSNNYVKSQLSQQQISFKPADELTDYEKSFTEARTGCIVTNAGKALTTGKQAECYANEFIGAHLKSPEGAAKGMTYAQLGDVQGELRAKIAAAKTSDPTTVPLLEKQLADTTVARETVFKGEMLRGALLTSFGFSTLGEKAGQGATIAYLGAALMALLSIAGFIHAALTPATKGFAVPEAARTEVRQKLVTS